ncbi:MAG: DNA-processing protein DprA [Rickettsiales bacterium]|nr:DNA-processing protein DprA [Rickettsiales bacterium]
MLTSHFNSFITNNSNFSVDCDIEKFNMLRLIRSENVGPVTFFNLIKIFGSATKVIDVINQEKASNISNMQLAKIKSKIKLVSINQINQEIEATKKFKAKLLFFTDDLYPCLLKKINNPPPVITCKGDISLLQKNIISIVGPRNGSFNGMVFAKKIAEELSNNEIVIASGMARGIDSSVHQASLKNGTIAVMAGGINKIYPPENQEMYKEISENGLILTEQGFDTPPKNLSFIQRNRIISGIALGTLVIEASIKSGSLITAKFAVEQGREVFAVPGSPLDSRCRGTNRLIREGAKMVENIDDILEEVAPIIAIKKSGEASFLEEDEEKRYIDENFDPRINPDNIDFAEKIYNLLGFGETEIPNIVDQLNVSTQLLNVALMELELADKIIIKNNKVIKK